MLGSVLDACSDREAGACRPAPVRLKMCVHPTIWGCLLMATAIPGASIGSGPTEVTHLLQLELHVLMI